MKAIVKVLVFAGTIFMLWAGFANAHATVIDDTDNSTQFFSLKGERLSPREAYQQDGKFLKCSVVQVHYNKNTGKPTIKK